VNARLPRGSALLEVTDIVARAASGSTGAALANTRAVNTVFPRPALGTVTIRWRVGIDSIGYGIRLRVHLRIRASVDGWYALAVDTAGPGAAGRRTGRRPGTVAVTSTAEQSESQEREQ